MLKIKLKKKLLLLFHTELPLITIHSEGKSPIEGENITLSCNATGNPEPSISWVKDGSPINSNSRISFSQVNKRLTITSISRTDSGEYQCVVRNRFGNDTSNSKVNVLCKCRTLFYFRVLLVITEFIIFIACSDILEPYKVVVSLLFCFPKLDEMVVYFHQRHNLPLDARS